MEELNNTTNFNTTEMDLTSPFSDRNDSSLFDTDGYYNYNPPGPINPFDFLPEDYKKARRFLYEYLVLIVWVISVLGNSLIIGVLCLKRNRNFSTSAYLTGLAVADMSLNTANDLLLYFRSHGYIPPPKSNEDCRYRNVFSFAISFIASWMLVIITIERVISVVTPHKVKRICTVRGARAIMIGVWVIFFGLAFLHESLIDVRVVAGITNCDVREDLRVIYFTYIVWLLIVLRFLLPYLLIFVSTIIIIAVLINRKIRKQSNQKSNKIKALNIALVNVNIVFLLTNFPYMFFYAFAGYTNLAPNNYYSYAKYYFWYIYLQVLNDMNSAVNVFVYFLNGTRFRTDVKEVLTRCCRQAPPVGMPARQSSKTISAKVSRYDGSNTTEVFKKPVERYRRQNSEFIL